MAPTRRTFLAATATAGSGALAGCSLGRSDCSVAGLLGGAWPQEGGDAGHTGQGDGAGPSDGEVAWRVGLGTEADRYAVESLAYADRTIYVAGVAREDDERRGLLRALDATVGATEWTVTPPGVPDGTPAVTAERVLVSTRPPADPDAGTLVAYDRSGEEVWRESFGGRLTASPTVHDGSVYVGTWDGSLRAYEVEDGTERWRVRFADERQTGSVFDAVAVTDSRLFVAVDGSRAAGLYALSTGDGEEVWRAMERVRFATGPVAHGDRVAVTDLTGQAAVFDAADGEFVWRVGFSDRQATPPAMTGESLYVADESVWAFALADGDRRWLVDSRVGATHRPTVGDRSLFVSGGEGVAALAPADGETRWRFRADVVTPPVLSGGVAFVGQTDGRVTALADC